MDKKTWNVVLELHCLFRDEDGKCAISETMSCKTCTEDVIKRRLYANVIKIEEVIE